MAYQHLRIRRDGPIEYLELHRPDVRNALTDQTIAELTHWAERIGGDTGVRAIVLNGAGKVFCTGADLGWMARVARYTHEENVADATAGARLFRMLDELPVPLIGRIHGAALGGGAGLAAICDVVVADEAAVFGFTEVKLGIIPAMIAPFVLAKIGRSAARELFLTGRRFDAARAKEIGLVHMVVPATELDSTVNHLTREILSAGPEAIAAAKALIAKVADRLPADAAGITAEAIAERRASAEGQEGLRAFLEKRKANWNVSPDSDR